MYNDKINKIEENYIYFKRENYELLVKLIDNKITIFINNKQVYQFEEIKMYWKRNKNGRLIRNNKVNLYDNLELFLAYAPTVIRLQTKSKKYLNRGYVIIYNTNKKQVHTHYPY